MNRILKIAVFGLLAASLALPAPALAKPEEGKKHGHGWKFWQKGTPEEREARKHEKKLKQQKEKAAKEAKKAGWKEGDTPPGWTKGEKTGWKGGSMPPGLSKKQKQS